MLFIGDEAGKVTVQDLGAILRRIEDLQEIDVTDPKKSGLKRNPYRSIPIQYDKKDNDIKTSNDEGIFKGEPLVDESEIRQICTYTPHKDVIRSIQFIYSTDRPLILTASLDRFVHLYSIEVHSEQDVAEREKGMVSVHPLLTCDRTCATRARCSRGTSANPTTCGTSSLTNSAARRTRDGPRSRRCCTKSAKCAMRLSPTKRRSR